jgi:hypothetical protein
MSNAKTLPLTQIFYYLKRNGGDSIYAFSTEDGLTVPIFSSMNLATDFLKRSRVRNYGISLISPTQMIDFADSCKEAGAKFLQLDAMPAVLKNAVVKSLMIFD